jgi:beta-ureidopropionase / N-carbamoyl-L-amino-acid hydrolase
VTFDALWSALEPIGRVESGGYRRFAWTAEDQLLREWFAAEAAGRGLDLLVDRAGNQWAWWGDPDRMPGVATGSHLDSVPDGGAFDGPLGVVSAFCAVDALRAQGFVPARPIGVVNFADEEGARFGIACAGSRLLTGQLAPARALGLRDGSGVELSAVIGVPARHVGRDDDALRRVRTFVELHVEQGRGLVRFGAPIGVARGIWPHGRWRFDLPGEANHAGTTALAERRDPTLGYARLVLAARDAAERHGALATCGKVTVMPNGVNAIPSHVSAWLDARGPSETVVRAVVTELAEAARAEGGTVSEESWTGNTNFDTTVRVRAAWLLGDAPVLATGAGHDAGILAAAGIRSGMIFVRNPSGVSHSPAEFAERTDCLAGVSALAAVLADLAGTAPAAPDPIAAQ